MGGSVGQTALNVQAGARSRWAAILSGIWMILILVAFSGVVGHVAMPTLAAVLVFAAIRSLRVTDLGAIMRTGATSQVALVTTFLCTLLLPIAAAVGIGVVISLLLQVDREALDLAMVELEPTPEGDFVERPAPAQLRSDHVILLEVYGSLYYAGARTLQAACPIPPEPIGRWWCCGCGDGSRWERRRSWCCPTTQTARPGGGAPVSSRRPGSAGAVPAQPADASGRSRCSWPSRRCACPRPTPWQTRRRG